MTQLPISTCLWLGRYEKQLLKLCSLLRGSLQYSLLYRGSHIWFSHLYNHLVFWSSAVKGSEVLIGRSLVKSYKKHSNFLLSSVMLMLFTEQHLRSPKSQRSKIYHLHLHYHYCAWTSHIDIPILAVSGNFVAMATAKLATSLIAFQAFMHMSITYRPSYPHTDAGTRSSVVERPNRKVVDSSPIRSHRGFFFLHRSLCHSPNDILLHLNHAAEIYHFHLHHYCCT